MEKTIPPEYKQYAESRHSSVLEGEQQQKLGIKGFWTGCFLSFFLALGAPYGSMVIKGSYMAMDFSTPGAIFLFLCLIGVLNLSFKIAGRSKETALVFALVVGLGWLYAYWPFEALDPYSPGLIFSTFVLVSSLINIPAVWTGRNLALNRSELIMVYAMLLIVAVLCTFGLGEQILSLITAIFYYASPENQWAEKLLPHSPHLQILVDDGAGNKAFYEGLPEAGGTIPYGVWVEPLIWWAIFLLALYATMVSIAVILRRQWMERERLPYPLAQVGLAMIRLEDEHRLVNGLFRRPAMWLGCAIPLFFGTLRAMHNYDPAFPAPVLIWHIPLLGQQSLQLSLSFAMVGFSYFIHVNVAAGIWFFHLLSKFEKETLYTMGLISQQRIDYGVTDATFMGYQGIGAMIAMVGVGLWTSREHIKNVFLKAMGRALEVDDGDEILSYRSAAIGAVGGILAMVGWLWLMGTPLWIALLFVVVAMLIFIGITRIVTEAGLAMVRAPMIAPDLIIQGLGSSLIGPTGMFNLSLAYIWAADVRVFVMASCANALKLIEEMPSHNRRMVFWAIILAVLIGALGSIWMIFHIAYEYGGINLSGWFFRGNADQAYSSTLRNLEEAGIYWPGMGFFCGGAGLMLLMIWAQKRLLWWPVHPVSFPVAGNSTMNYVWFGVFLAWLIKKMVLRFGGVALYQRLQAFFLGLIAGQALANGVWMVIDYFTGKTGNRVFYI